MIYGYDFLECIVVHYIVVMIKTFVYYVLLMVIVLLQRLGKPLIRLSSNSTNYLYSFEIIDFLISNKFSLIA